MLANDSDHENDSLSITSVSVANGNGNVSIVDGKVSFDPGTDFDYLSNSQSANVEITYIVSDGNSSTTGTLTLTVNGETDQTILSDGSKLTSLSLSSNQVTRGSDGVEFNFAVDGAPVTITIEVTDTFGNDHLFSVTGTDGTMLLPMDGTERNKAGSSETNISNYEITSIYIEDANGVITYLTIDNLNEYNFNTTVSVNSGSISTDNSPPELSDFALTSAAITLGDGETPQLLSFAKPNGSSAIDGVLVKFVDQDGVLHSNYIDASSGTFSLYFNPETSPSGTYTLYSVEVFGTENNSNSYSLNDIQTQFGASETTFTLTNPDTIDLSLPLETPFTYMDAETHNTTGDPLIDGILSGRQLSPNPGGEPLIITYSFASPELSVFLNGYSDTDYELSQNISQLTGEQQQVVRDMLDNISQDVNIVFVEIPDDGNSSAGQMRFAWTNGGSEDVSGTLAWAYYPGNTPHAGDVWLIEGGLDDQSDIDTSDSLFESTILHEIGHALGLKHPFDIDGNFGVLPIAYDGNDYTVMSYDTLAIEGASYDDIAIPTDLMWLDIQALQFLYGANTSQSGGDDTYTILPEEWNYFALWDAGGTDTIDFSYFSSNIEIDLTPDSWNDVGLVIDVVAGSSGNRTETLHIAPDTIIENAIGGSGNDTITGNSSNNIIEGGAGQDDMSGGSGDDTFIFDGNSDINLDSINGGSGTDTLQFNGAMSALDLSDVNASNIEIINSTNTNPLDLTLDINDVLDIADNNNILIIAGTDADTVTSTGSGWSQVADQVVNSETYHVYTSGSATLFIDEDITQFIS
ncbi:MAG: M10 family metallopeptidase C-terminal domain-containing protein [Emcibacteraceae bacterium]|nr:M10 family metallopeptidase C-terminal domain-containing protein [Emcibacteraceae bacterium]